LPIGGPFFVDFGFSAQDILKNPKCEIENPK